MTLSDLIERLEQATEGSRELECRISLSLFDPQLMVDPGGYSPEQHPAEYAKASKAFGDLSGWSDWEGLYHILDAKPWTTSIDAALTLYLRKPERVPSDPRLACIEALRQRDAIAGKSG